MENETEGFVLTPAYEHIFKTMLHEAKIQAQADCLFDGMLFGGEAQALRTVQRFLAPLNIAAQCMTNREAVEQFREVIAAIVQDIDKTAAQREGWADAAREHRKVQHGQCPVCKHYGDDCTGEEE